LRKPIRKSRTLQPEEIAIVAVFLVQQARPAN
jgi:hypothetical protein